MLSKKIGYSDLHLRLADPLGVMTPEGMNSRLKQKLNALEQVVTYAIEHHCDEIIDFGDLFDSINPPSKIRNAFARLVGTALEKGIRWTRICGNHETDGVTADGLDLSLISLQYSVVTSIQNHPDYENLLMIPEVDYGDILKALEAHPDSAVFGHFEVNGAVYSNDQTSTRGIPQVLLQNRVLGLYLGHIHKRQKMCAEKITYIGAMSRHNFGDATIPIGCSLFTIESDEGHVENIRLEFLPIDDIGLHTYTFSEKDSEPQDGFDCQPGDIVKLVYECSHSFFAQCNPEEVAALLIKEKGVARVLIDFRPQCSIEDDSVVTFDDFDLMELVKEQAKEDGFDSDLGLHYLKEAQSENSES